MNRWAIAFLTAGVLGNPGCGLEPPEKGPDDALTIRNVNVIDVVTGHVDRHRTILMRAGRIVAIRPDSNDPGAEATDGRGGYAVPGLWDAHVHLSDATLTDAARELPYFLRAGVTTVRDMGGNLSVVDTLREMEGRGLAIGPRIVRAGPFIDGPKDGAPDRIAVETMAEAPAAVAALQAEHVDFIKIHNGVSREVFMAVTRSARAANLRVAVHLPRSLSAEEAAAAGIATLEHAETVLESGLRSLTLAGRNAQEARQALEFESRAGPDRLMAIMKKNDVCFTPTLSEYRGFSALPRAGYEPEVPGFAPASLVAFWDRFFPPEPADAQWKNALRQEVFGLLVDFVGKMNRAGVTIVAGTDFGARDMYPGYSLHEELALLSKAGLSNLDVLRSATLNPARCMGRSDTMGRLAVGMVADVLVLPDSPLDDIANLGRPRLVIAAGRVAWEADRSN